MRRNVTVILIICLLCGCTENLRQKNKPKPTIYPPVHYSLKDTVPSKTKEPNTDSIEQEVGRTPKIVHKALCRFTKLSEEFDFALSVDMGVDSSGFDVFLKTYVHVISKANDSLLQTIQFAIGTNSGKYDCIARSYSTGHNREAESMDGFFGDIVVADLNFDGKEDIAIARGFGYTMFYNFYLQDGKGQFILNKYLSENLASYPDNIDTSALTIETFNTAGAKWYALSTYGYNKQSRKYKLIRHQSFDFETGKLEYDYLKGK